MKKLSLYGQEYDLYDFHLGSNTQVINIGGTQATVIADLR